MPCKLSGIIANIARADITLEQGRGGNYYFLLISTSLVYKQAQTIMQVYSLVCSQQSFHLSFKEIGTDEPSFICFLRILSLTSSPPPPIPGHAKKNFIMAPPIPGHAKKNFIMGMCLAQVRSISSLFYDTVKHKNRKKISN